MNRRPGKILSPVDDTLGVSQVVQVVHVESAEIGYDGGDPRSVAEAAPGRAGSEEAEEERRPRLEDSLGALSVKMEDGGRFPAQELDLFSAKIEGGLPGEGENAPPRRRRGVRIRSGCDSRLG